MLTIRAISDGMRKELFYVAASWGRKSVLVFTGDKQLLRESVACSAARQSASELARKKKPGFGRGIHRGLAAARQMVRCAAWYLSLILRREIPVPARNSIRKSLAVAISFRIRELSVGSAGQGCKGKEVDQRFLPALPYSGKPDPEHTIRFSQAPVGVNPSQNGELLS
jgi:hypothetical protein